MAETTDKLLKHVEYKLIIAGTAMWSAVAIHR